VRRGARARGDSGLTLVELLVTLIVASLVASSTFVFFSGQQRIYDTQTKILNIQQNLWAAVETLSRHVRAAGTGMLNCTRPDSDAAGPDTGDPPPGGNVTPATGLRAYRAGTGPIRIPPLWIRNGTGGAPDTLTVAFGNGTFGNNSDATLRTPLAADMPADPIFTGPGMSRVFRPGEFIVLLDVGFPGLNVNQDRGCTLFQITGIDPAGDEITHDATSPWNPPGNVAGLVPFTYPAGASGGVRDFGQLNWVQFAIDSTGAPDVPPRLTMNRLDGNSGPQVLAEGIEDLQIAYACDTQPNVPDGVLSEGTNAASRATDEWIYNAAGDIPPPACKRPVAVRITLVARSVTMDSTLVDVAGNSKPVAEDGAAGPPDTYRHRVINTTVYPRN
jgi:prepilin-type N-terminal cleavage/methylation domain-containing protein